MVVILFPFLLFFIFAIPKISSKYVFADYPSELGKPKISTMISTIIWQCSGFDTLGALSSEVKNSKVTFPLSMIITIGLIILVYLLPTIAGVSIEPDLKEWGSGAFAPVSKKLPHCSNGWLSIWISISGACSSLSLMNVALSCTGRELYACGNIDAIPFSSFFSKLHNNFNGDKTPLISIIFMGLITIPLSFFDFSKLVEWTGILTVIAQLIQVVVFIACRIPGYFDKIYPIFLKYNKSEDSPINNEDILQSSQDMSNSEYLIKGDESSQQITEEEKSSYQIEEENVSNNNISNNGFIVPGGVFGVILIVVPITAISIYLIIISGWFSILVSFGLILCMFVLQGLYLFVQWSIGILCKQRNIEKIN